MDSDDSTYAVAQPRANGLALGRTFAAIYQGMTEGGVLSEEDALAILTEYVTTLAANVGTDTEDSST